MNNFVYTRPIRVCVDGRPLYQYPNGGIVCGCTLERERRNMSENDPEDKGPINPISLLLEAAISMHEMYLNFVAAGFTEAQALTLVAQTLRPQSNA